MKKLTSFILSLIMILGSISTVSAAEAKFAIEPQFEDVLDFSEGLAAVEQDGQWGYIDKTGKIVIGPQFAVATPFSEGLAAVVKNGKWSYIDKTGKICGMYSSIWCVINYYRPFG